MTNRAYKAFVDAGGYRNTDYWKAPFVTADGGELTFPQAMAQFTDTTGRPGPATWELGTYPEGEDDHPVRGVSWFEAAAFAEYAGKSLPTLYHWYRAAGGFEFFLVTQLSNFDGDGPEPVGSREGLGPFGTYDMAGNVKEWCWNRTADRRYLLGGSWGEPLYMYTQQSAQPPFERRPNYGFRLARFDEPPPDELTTAAERAPRDYSREVPADDTVFEVIKGLYAYDPGELDALVEEVDDSSPHFRREKVTFESAYGERIIAYLYLPKGIGPPYQTVVYFPGASSLQLSAHQNVMMRRWDWIPRTGRALMFPIYRGQHERLLETRVGTLGPRARRDITIQWHKDLGRAIDYLESRPDIASDKIAYLGFSMGANIGPIFLALEQRIRAAILTSGGLSESDRLPEVDPFHFLPRVKTPVLMLNGRNDFAAVYETSQLPFFEHLGTPDVDKKHIVFDVGHFIPLKDVIRETLTWLDRYLGPVPTGR